MFEGAPLPSSSRRLMFEGSELRSPRAPRLSRSLLRARQARFDHIRQAPVAPVEPGHVNGGVARLGERRNSTEADDGAVARVVRGDRELEVAVELVGEDA